MAKKKRKPLKDARCKLAMPAASAELANPMLAVAQRSGVRTAGVCAALVVLVFIVFGQVLGHEFVNFDDDYYVTNNPYINRGFSAENVAWVFQNAHVGNWHPMTGLSHILDCELYDLGPAGHHLTSLLLHAATSVLLFLVLRRMTGDFWPSAFAAFLFAIHPLRAESVAWVSERKDVLSGLFFVLTLAAYVRYTAADPARKTGRRIRYLVMLGVFALGLMSKAMLVTLPCILLLLDVWPLKRHLSIDAAAGASPPSAWRRAARALVEMIPLFALSAISGTITLFTQQPGVHTLETVSVSARLGNAAVSYAAYLAQTICPVGMAALYPHPGNALPWWQPILATIVLVVISAAVYRFRHGWPFLAVGWLWYLVMLAPVIGILQVGNQARADRYTYLPHIGLFIAASWAAAGIANRFPARRWLVAGAGAVVVSVLAVVAGRQAGFWHDSETLWLHALECTDRNAVAHMNLGTTRTKQGRHCEAAQQYQKATEIIPDYASAYNNLGQAMLQLGQLEQAAQYFDEACKLNPSLPEAYYNLGVAASALNRFEEAVRHFQNAIVQNPDFAKAHNNLGVALIEVGRVDEAVLHLRRAIELDPDFFEAVGNLGNAMERKGNLAAGELHWRKAIAMNPAHAKAHLAMADSLFRQKRFAEVESAYRAALAADPNLPEAMHNYAVFLCHQKRIQEAIPFLEKALSIRPRFADWHYSMGVALYELGRADQALSHWRKAAEINPNSPLPRVGIGNILAQRGQLDAALAQYRKAIAIDPHCYAASENVKRILAAAR